MSLFITIGYIVIAFLLFNRATRGSHCPLHRASNAFMAMAVLAFGTGRWLLFATGEFHDWLFMMGHVCFFCFASVYLLKGELPVIGGKPK